MIVGLEVVLVAGLRLEERPTARGQLVADEAHLHVAMVLPS